MDLSSLVFVAIIGVWAAYLVPHWLSRRDDLSESRTPDRFSGRLRVLQRRSPKAHPTRAGHRSGDAVLTSPRVVVDADGEYLYIPADRALAARAQREAEEAAAAEMAVVAASESSAAEPVAAEPAAVPVAVEPVAAESAEPADAESESTNAEPTNAESTNAEPTFAELTAARPAGSERTVSDRQRSASSTASIPIAEPTPIAVSDASPVASSGYVPSRTHTAPVSRRPADSTALPSAPAPSPPEVEIPDRPFDLEVAIGIARLAARRRAMIMALLFVATVSSFAIASATSASTWVAVPASVLLVLHVLASRVAGLRSRETLMLLAVQVRSAEMVQARPQRQYASRTQPTDAATPAPPARTPERVARRAAAVGAETWEPIPVPPPTYTLKPAARRAEPAPLERPETEAPAAAVSRGALPRRAADVERILALESHLDDLFEEPKVVNG